MEGREIHETITEHAHAGRGVAVYVAALAAALAIVTVLGSNSARDMMDANIKASDAYSYYQAKNLRQIELRTAARELELGVLTRNDLTPAQRDEAQQQVTAFRSQADRFESEPETGDGKRELKDKASRFEAIRDVAAARDPWFDVAEAMLQLAIVLASVATVLEQAWPMRASWACAGIGLVAALNGVFLLADWNALASLLG